MLSWRIMSVKWGNLAKAGVRSYRVLQTIWKHLHSILRAVATIEEFYVIESHHQICVQGNSFLLPGWEQISRSRNPHREEQLGYCRQLANGDGGSGGGKGRRFKQLPSERRQHLLNEDLWWEWGREESGMMPSPLAGANGWLAHGSLPREGMQEEGLG